MKYEKQKIINKKQKMINKKWKTKDKKEKMKNPKMESEKWVKIYQNIKKHLCHMLNKSWFCINLIIIILASMFHPILKNIWKSLEFLETQFQNVITSWGKIATLIQLCGITLTN